MDKPTDKPTDKLTDRPIDTKPIDNPPADNTVAVFTAPGRVELRREPLPTIRPGEVLVRVHSCGLCTMEQRLFRGAIAEYPIIPGHESGGVVAAVSPDVVLDIAPGDRVAIAFLDRCMQCFYCRRGQSQLCTGKFKGRAPGVLRRIGGLGRYVAVPAWKLLPVPAHVSFEALSLVEPMACVIHSLSKVDLQFGDDVLVIGGGTMGHLHMLLARLRGVRVLLSEPDPGKQRLARQHGAHAVCAPADALDRVAELTGGRGADAVFVTYGSADTARQAYQAVRPGGRVVYYGSFAKDADFAASPRRIHREEIVLDGARSQKLTDWSQAIRLLSSNLIEVEHVVSEVYPLEAIETALTRAIAADAFRIVVSP